MKTIYKSFLFAIIAAAGFTACSDYDAPDVTTPSAVTILSHETSFPAAASTGTITFKADGPVTVSSSSSWLTASVDGNTINLAVEQNNNFDGRAATLTIKCGNATDEISVLQSGIIFKFDEVSTIDIDSDAWSQSYAAEASVDISTSSDAEWLSASVADGALTINAQRNTVLSPRTGIITVKVGDLSYDITVNQGALQCPLVKVTSISQNDNTKTYTYNFPTDIAVDFTSPDWIKASFANETITIVVDENNEGHIREGELIWTVDGTTGTVTISQHDFDKDIAGSYRFVYPRNGQLYAFNAKLTSKAIEFPDLELAIPITFNTKTRTIAITPGGNCGTWTDEDGTATIFTLFSFIKDGKSMVTAAETAYMQAFVEFEAEGNVGYTIAMFEDAGLYTYPVASLILAGFMSEELDFNYYEYNLLNFTSPYLMRSQAIATPATTPLKLAKQETGSGKVFQMNSVQAAPIASLKKGSPFAY